MEAPRRLGLFGGSFDPIHTGHLHAARVAQGAFGLHRVVFVPAARPPHKPGRELASGSHRLAMIELAIAGEPTWCASDVELRREGPSYTVDTVPALAAAVGEPADARVFLVLGSDNLPGLPSWRSVEELLRLAQPVIVLRGGDDGRLPASVRASLSDEAIARLEEGIVRAAPAPGASTELRDALSEGERRPPELPPAVQRYVAEHGLYGGRRWD